MNTGVVLELPFPSELDAKRALVRGAYRRSARALREIGYPGAALALEALAEGLRTTQHPVADDGEVTVIDMLPSRRP